MPGRAPLISTPQPRSSLRRPNPPGSDHIGVSDFGPRLVRRLFTGRCQRAWRVRRRPMRWEPQLSYDTSNSSESVKTHQSTYW